ncbi:hypothetical protein FJU11_03815 [Pararhizobium mangrovi]|uniref:Uncharacterized protein n=2 Tax=Pararhizobium mangrovi TaxID=2590452 RepID=A0A506UEW4_9HYPH|nr:hypothetical protein FJU11_03815 [Pararhizobium mangrovi]
MGKIVSLRKERQSRRRDQLKKKIATRLRPFQSAIVIVAILAFAAIAVLWQPGGPAKTTNGNAHENTNQ